MRHPRARTMLTQAVPALVVGVSAALVLLVVGLMARLWQHGLWDTLPPLVGATATTWWWVMGVLTLSGVAVGLVVHAVPGHAGPDPATVALGGPPMPVGVVPGLALALVLALGGGVSLGPENPLVAMMVALTVGLGGRVLPCIPPERWGTLAVAGTIGAIFGTPVAAALLFTERVRGDQETPLWDQLFAPLVAAGAGGMTMTLVEPPHFTLAVAPYSAASLLDCVRGTGVALAAVALGLVAVQIFPRLHRGFHVFRHPVCRLAVGGALLGGLGVLGGPLTMFKGLAEMQTLAAAAPSYPVATLVLLVVVKLAAVLIAATCGFHGGRISPMVFVGVAFGSLAHQLVPSIPLALAIASAVLGFVLVVTRAGWLSLFLAALVIPGAGGALLPLLCLVVLPAWVVVAGRPGDAHHAPRRGAGRAACR